MVRRCVGTVFGIAWHGIERCGMASSATILEFMLGKVWKAWHVVKWYAFIWIRVCYDCIAVSVQGQVLINKNDSSLLFRRYMANKVLSGRLTEQSVFSGVLDRNWHKILTSIVRLRQSAFNSFCTTFVSDIWWQNSVFPASGRKTSESWSW